LAGCVDEPPPFPLPFPLLPPFEQAASTTRPAPPAPATNTVRLVVVRPVVECESVTI
jgi:hypothetical protein